MLALDTISTGEAHCFRTGGIRMEAAVQVLHWLVIGGMTIAGVIGVWETFFRQ